MLPLVRNPIARRDWRAETWVLVLLMAVAVALGLRWSGLTLSASSVVWTGLFLASSGVLAFHQDRIKQPWLKRLIDFFEVFALLGAMSLLGCIASYVIAATTHGYQDALLARLDSIAGLDWRVAYSGTMQSPTIQAVGRNAYSMVIQLPILLLTILCATGRGHLARRYLVAFGVSLILTMFFFALAPAAGPISYYQLAHDSYHPQTGHEKVALIDLLRGGGIAQIELGNLHGLVSFPSFHAAAGILLLWIAPWFGRFRWPIWIATLMMLAATPVEGNHYFVDLFEGGLNAIVAVWLSRLGGFARLGRKLASVSTAPSLDRYPASIMSPGDPAPQFL